MFAASQNDHKPGGSPIEVDPWDFVAIYVIMPTVLTSVL